MLLANYTQFARAVIRSVLNDQHGSVPEALDGVARANGKPIYAAFQNYDGRELRAQQGYPTKFPAASVALLFELPSGGKVVTSTSGGRRLVQAMSRGICRMRRSAPLWKGTPSIWLSTTIVLPEQHVSKSSASRTTSTSYWTVLSVISRSKARLGKI